MTVSFLVDERDRWSGVVLRSIANGGAAGNRRRLNLLEAKADSR
jgi:hypothetical protein